MRTLRRAAFALLFVLTSADRALAEDQPVDGEPVAAEDDPLACGNLADNDASTRIARFQEHYDRAGELIEMGEYERAIPEFRAAYCVLPEPEPVLAIATAYERLVNYDQAVRWLELYISKLPPARQRERDNIAHRVTILRRLPARVRIATEPPSAEILLEPDNGDAPLKGVANTRDPIAVRAGKYRMTISMSGFEPVTEEVQAEIGQPYTYYYRLAPKTGVLRVAADPASARIFVDKKLVGVGSYVDRLPIGVHTVVVEAPGYTAQDQDTYVTSETTASLKVKLIAPPATHRWELIAAATSFGLLAAPIVGTTAGLDDTSNSLVSLVGGGLGFAGTYLAVPEKLPVGRSSYIIGASVWGSLEAIGIATAVTNFDNGDLVGAVSVAGAVTGALGAALTAARLDLSAGDAALVNSGGVWGSTAGFLFYGLFDEEPRLFGPLLLAGLNCGLLAGGALSYRYDFSRAHVALIDLAGVAGAISGTALSSAFAKSFAGEDRPIHFTLGGIGVGLLVGALLTRNMDEVAEPSGVAALTPMLDRTPDGTSVYGLSLGW